MSDRKSFEVWVGHPRHKAPTTSAWDFAFRAWQASALAERERAAQAFEAEVSTWDEMLKLGYSGAIRRKGAAAIRKGIPALKTDTDTP